MVCYMASWAVYRQGPGMFDVEDVDPNICTHLIFAFAGITTTGEINVLDPHHELCDNGGECAYNRFTALKKQNPELKTLLGVGGWEDGSEKYSKMAADPSMRKIFIDTSIALLKEHNFDGIDLDWEYPTMRGGIPEDKENYVILLSEIHDALHAEGMILTAAVSSAKDKIDFGYDVPGIAMYVDLLNLMTYDLHGSWNDYVHHQSGLYPTIRTPAVTKTSTFSRIDEVKDRASPSLSPQPVMDPKPQQSLSKYIHKIVYWCPESVMVCYMASWAVYRQGPGMFDVEDVDPNICTHLIFAFAGITTTGEINVLDPHHELCDNGGECAYNRFTALKKQNPELKTLLGVGGWEDGSEKYSKMAADPSMRKIFIDTSIALLKEHNFDGIDLDWEYPTMRGGIPEDKENYVILLSEIHDALHAEGMILTAAVSSAKDKIDSGYDVPGIAMYVDLLNLMTYDLHGSWNDYVHHQSGLYPYYKDTGGNKDLNVDFAVNYWIQQGMPSTKIAVGVPSYGRCWTLDDLSQTDYYSPASEPGEPGPWTNSAGIWAYSEVHLMKT
ncbi:chitotriosidase-1-like [Homarus americanus]|uniref:chitotriosidase-1-like n=1 Tax=Homarus americanus TaxID=6706 RepID=UPI001C439EF7|nr:chitotriosidase-1-like [Homarus americanus]